MAVIVAYPAFKNRHTNPVQALLYTELQELGWKVFDLDVALKKRILPDILHLHWPDGFVFHRSFVKSVFRAFLLLGLLLFYRLTGARIVWTIHNFHSHEGFHPNLEKGFWKIFYRLIHGWIALSDYSQRIGIKEPGLAGNPHAVIRHGLYPVFGKEVVETRDEPGLRFLFVGKLREYKGIPSLVEAFEALDDPEAQLRIAGECCSPSLREYLESKGGITGLTVSYSHIKEVELARLLRWSNCVVLPYQEFSNSGVALLALSYNRLLLAPQNPVMQELKRDFGERSVFLFESPLNLHNISAHILDFPSRRPSGGSENFPSHYRWPEIAKAHDSFFQNISKS